MVSCPPDTPCPNGMILAGLAAAAADAYVTHPLHTLQQ